MERIAEGWRRVRVFLQREQFDRDLAREMHFHLEMKIQANLEAGMSPDEARKAALKQFGNQENTAIFSIINAVLLKPLPLPQSDRLFTVTAENHIAGDKEFGASAADFSDWQRLTKSFQGMAIYNGMGAFLTGSELPESILVGRVSADTTPLPPLDYFAYAIY